MSSPSSVITSLKRQKAAVGHEDFLHKVLPRREVPREHGMHRRPQGRDVCARNTTYGPRIQREQLLSAHVSSISHYISGTRSTVIGCVVAQMLGDLIFERKYSNQAAVFVFFPHALLTPLLMLLPSVNESQLTDMRQLPRDTDTIFGLLYSFYGLFHMRLSPHPLLPLSP